MSLSVQELPDIPSDPREGFAFCMGQYKLGQERWKAEQASTANAGRKAAESGAPGVPGSAREAQAGTDDKLQWPLDKAFQGIPCENAQDWARVEATFWMASAQFYRAEVDILDNAKKQKSLSGLNEMLMSMMDASEFRAVLRKAGVDTRPVEVIRGEAAQAALKTMLCAPGAPASWGERLPGKTYCAIDLLPEGAAKAALQKGVMRDWEGISVPKVERAEAAEATAKSTDATPPQGAVPMDEKRSVPHAPSSSEATAPSASQSASQSSSVPSRSPAKRRL